jgi:hypothetical protein
MYEPRHPGDAKDLPLFISRAPTEAAVVAIRDVIVVPTTIVQGDYPSEDEQPAGDPAVEIADSLTLEHLSTGDSGAGDERLYPARPLLPRGAAVRTPLCLRPASRPYGL